MMLSFFQIWRGNFARLILVYAFVLCLSQSANAQTQPPKITSVLPIGAARGSTMTVTIEGMNLGQGSAVLPVGDGLQIDQITPQSPAPAKNTAGKLTCRIAIATDALPGRRPLRVLTPFGISDVGYFVVDKYPNVEEKESNNTLQTAQEVSIATPRNRGLGTDNPITLVGKIEGGEDVDCFKFAGKKGQMLIADVQAARIGSALDSVVTLLDAKGHELAQNEDHNGPDSFLAFSLPADGTYILRLNDLRFQGSANHFYRLALGSIPNVITGVFPAGGRAGTTPQLQLLGYNLSNPLVSVPLIGTDHSEISPFWFPLVNDFAFSAVPLQIGIQPELREAEPNDTRETAQKVTLPAVINGRFLRKTGSGADRDFFRFHADKGENLILEVFARRLDSPVDSLLTLTNSAGNEIASNDDASGKDSRIDFTAPDSADYVVQVSELTQRTGDDFVYRLSIAPPQSDFTLSFSPAHLIIGQGGRVPIRVTATRREGYNIAIPFGLPNLPTGVSASGSFSIPPGQTETFVVLSTDSKAASLAAPLAFVGTGFANAKPITRNAAPLAEEYVKQNDQIVRTTRPTVLPMVSVSAAPPDLIVSLSADKLTLNLGKTAELTVNVIRAEGFKAKIPLQFLGLPAGVSITPAEIPEGQTSLKVAVKAEGNAPIGEFSVVCTARVVFDELRFTPHAALPLTLTIAK